MKLIKNLMCIFYCNSNSKAQVENSEIHTSVSYAD